MNIKNLSNKYVVRGLDVGDIDAIFELCSKNSLYYQYCPPFITKNGVVEDMETVPPGKTRKDKYFLGYYEDKSLIAVIDLITGYPNLHTLYIGFFMTDIHVQGQGIGTVIIEELCDYAGKIGFQRVELAWVKGNPQAEAFWIKNKFKPIGERRSNVAEHVIAAERQL